MIRQMTRKDVQQLPALHSQGTETQEKRETSHIALTELFPRLYFDHPWSDGTIDSLVSEDGDGRINGMMGVIRRPMQFEGRQVQMAVCSELYVHPSSRSSMVGIQLVRHFLNGSQDISFTDISNSKSRMIWERLKGAVAPFYCINWIRPLRPAQFLLAIGRERKLSRTLTAAGAPMAKLMDRLIASRRARPSLAQPALRAEPLTPSLFAEQFDALTGTNRLQPEYDTASAFWTWSRLDYLFRDSGLSRQVAVRNHRGQLLGWYIYQVQRGGIGKVAHIAARDAAIGQVLQHLFDDAAEQGAAGLMGRLQPNYTQALSDAGCLFRPRSTYTLAHSRNPELLQPFLDGRAFLTLIEGEACLDIWNEPARSLAALPANDQPSRSNLEAQADEATVSTVELVSV